MDLSSFLSEKEEKQIEELTNKAFNIPAFRTDTEIRILILDSSKYPTPAAKYYKALNEINKVKIELTNLMFEYNLQEQNLESIKNEIEVDKIKFTLKNLKREIEGRAKELFIWDNLIKEIEPVLAHQGIPLDNPDAHQKVFLLINHIRRCIKAVTEEKMTEPEIRNLFTSLVTNAKIVEQGNLVSTVLTELSLSEKHFVNIHNILSVTFTEDERKLIEEASELGQKVPNKVNKEIEDLRNKLDTLAKQQN